MARRLRPGSTLSSGCMVEFLEVRRRLVADPRVDAAGVVEVLDVVADLLVRVVLGPGEYSTFGEIDFEGERHAVSLDFDVEQLSRILAKGSPTLRRWIERQIRRDPISPRSIDLPEPIHCGIRAHLGEEQRGQFETFVPLVIESVL